MTRTLMIITILLFACLMVVPSLADSNAPSTIPHAFYGSIYNFDGSDAQEGSIVVASVKGVLVGTITTTQAGQYGTEYSGGDKLIVWNTGLYPGDTINFYIDGVRAVESAVFESGGVSNLTLNAEKELPKERPEESTTHSVNTTGGQPVTINSDGVSADLTTTGDFQGETIIFTLFTKPPDDQVITPGKNSISRFAEITCSILNQNIQKVIVRVHYSDSDSIGTDENSIRVYWWSGNGWIQLPGGVDTNANFAWGETDHFSTFALLGTPASKPSGGGGGGGVNVIITPTPTNTSIPTKPQEEIPPTMDGTVTAVATPSIIGEPVPMSGEDISKNEPGTEGTENFPIVPVIIVAGIVAVFAAGFILLRRH